MRNPKEGEVRGVAQNLAKEANLRRDALHSMLVASLIKLHGGPSDAEVVGIGRDVRDKIDQLIGHLDVGIAKDPRFTAWRQDALRGVREINKEGEVDSIVPEISWQAVKMRLLANNGEKFKLVAALQGGGQLFGIDSEGNLLFKDRGDVPVLYGFDEEGNLMTIFNRDERKMKKVIRWANYKEIYEAVYGKEGKPTGYEMFPAGLDEKVSPEVEAAESFMGGNFVDRGAPKGSNCTVWLDSGREAETGLKYLRTQYVEGEGYLCFAHDNDVLENSDITGVMRLVRV